MKIITLNNLTAKACAQEKSMAVRWKRFTTHVARTKNKLKKDKYVKFGGNILWSGSLNRQSRAIAVKNVHDAMEPAVLLLKEAMLQEGLSPEGPWTITTKISVHPGYGDVMRRVTKGQVVIKGGEKAIDPDWDTINWWPWVKCFEDCCVSNGVLVKDTADVTREHRIKWVPVEKFSQRSLTFVFQPHQS